MVFRWDGPEFWQINCAAKIKAKRISEDPMEQWTVRLQNQFIIISAQLN